ncbi:MAG: beta-propeller fold lactonase family protein [Puniceicoccales bacterium]|jgi:YVTN family beta-propeller protein|nr:beta-propeller fold lactonase family protein [Puniceicoccales bacterium]
MKKNLWLLLLLVFCAASSPERYLSPGQIALDKKQRIVYTALTTDKAVAVTSLKDGKTVARIELEQNPSFVLLSPDAATLFVSSGVSRGVVDIFALPEKKLKASIPVGHTPQAMALTPDGKTLYVANRFSNTISVVSLDKGSVIATIPAVREPRSLCLTLDGKILVVANFLPAQAATETVIASQVTLFDVPANTIRATLTLPTGSQSAQGIAISPDGRFVYITHLISQYSLPATQLERGWMNTNALSIIEPAKNEIYATVLLDDVDNGAANPDGLCYGGDGKLYIALAGTHQLLALDMVPMHQEIEALFSGSKKFAYIKDKEGLSTSLSFTAPFKKRIPLLGRVPHAVEWLPDAAANGGRAIVSSRFSTFLEIPASAAIGTLAPVSDTIALGTESAPSSVRRGELAFADATICYQQWQSCVSCHPDGRADGFNWDQQNDGLGNPKNTKSLLFSHVTPPCMITGIRESAELAVRKGIIHILQSTQPDTLASDMDEYLKAMRPLESPALAEREAKDPGGKKGRALFMRAACAKCHIGEFYTDMRKHNVGTGIGDDTKTLFDTPTLREIWRTPPYLYDGRAVTLRDVLTEHNKDDKHGITSKLTKEELDTLILYISTL